MKKIDTTALNITDGGGATQKHLGMGIWTTGGALGKINRLRGVEFEWKGSGKRDLGVVAEEVGQVFPEIVDYETSGRDARGLDYSKLVAIGVK